MLNTIAKRFFQLPRLRPSGEIITVTESAWIKLKAISKQLPQSHFIFTAKGGGCGGFNYELRPLQPDDLKESQHHTTMEQDGVLLTVDPLVEMHLIGTKIDFKSEDFKAGVWESKFEFIPDPKLASTCGCGVSFTPRDKD